MRCGGIGDAWRRLQVVSVGPRAVAFADPWRHIEQSVLPLYVGPTITRLRFSTPHSPALCPGMTISRYPGGMSRWGWRGWGVEVGSLDEAVEGCGAIRGEGGARVQRPPRAEGRDGATPLFDLRAHPITGFLEFEHAFVEPAEHVGGPLVQPDGRRDIDVGYRPRRRRDS